MNSKYSKVSSFKHEELKKSIMSKEKQFLTLILKKYANMLNNLLFMLSNQNTKLCDTTGISRKFSQVIFWLLLSLIGLPLDGFAQTECLSVNIKIQKITNNSGVIVCAIFQSE